MAERKFTTGADAMPQGGKPAKKEDPEPEVQKLIKEIRTILNNLTPNTFIMLMQRILSLKIDTEKKLRIVVDLIFEKAISEPTYSEAYANMCHQMTSIKVAPDEINHANPDLVEPVEFRKLLLTRCQRKFQENQHDDAELLELKKSVEQAENVDLAVQMRKYESRTTVKHIEYLGNIRLIGELFKLRILTESIMHNCIMSLLKARTEEKYEGLCVLLTTIGRYLDHQKGKRRMDQYFEMLRKIIHENRTSLRVKSMLGQVCNLRLNNWVVKKAESSTSNLKNQSKTVRPTGQKWKKPLIKIDGTNTNRDGIDDITNGQGYTSTLAWPPGRSGATTPTSVDVGAIFAAKVALAAGLTEPTTGPNRERRMITIRDTNTNLDITDEIIKGQRHSSSSVNPSGTTPSATVDAASMFAAAGSTESKAKPRGEGSTRNMDPNSNSDISDVVIIGRKSDLPTASTSPPGRKSDQMSRTTPINTVSAGSNLKLKKGESRPSTPLYEFSQLKSAALQKVDFCEKESKKEAIHGIVCYINNQPDYFVSTCCSGRIQACYLNPHSTDTVTLPNADSSPSCVKNGACFFVSHDNASSDGVIKSMKKVRHSCALKFEPLLLHVQCRTVESARVLHEFAIKSGFHNSGVSFKEDGKEITAVIRGAGYLEIPLTDEQGKQLTSDIYVEYVTKIANERLKDNQKRIDVFQQNIVPATAFGSGDARPEIGEV